MIDQLIANIKKTNASIVVGLDPMMKFIPGADSESCFCGIRRDVKGRCRSDLAVQ